MAVQVDMKKTAGSDDAAMKTCWTTLLKYCGNVAQVQNASIYVPWRPNMSRRSRVNLLYHWDNHLSPITSKY